MNLIIRSENTFAYKKSLTNHLVNQSPSKCFGQIRKKKNKKDKFHELGQFRCEFLIVV